MSETIQEEGEAKCHARCVTHHAPSQTLLYAKGLGIDPSAGLGGFYLELRTYYVLHFWMLLE